MQRSSERYSVSISTMNPQKSVLLGKKTPGQKFKSASRKVSALVAVAAMLLAIFVGTIMSAPKANAAFGIDFTAEFCKVGVQNLTVEDRSSLMTAKTGDGKTQAIPTPYEKYGFSGLTWSSMIGFDGQESITANDNTGSRTSVNIITETGGNSEKSGLTQWQDAVGDKPEDHNKRAGLWNAKQECAPYGVSGDFAANSVANAVFSFGKGAVFFGGLLFQVATETSSSLFKWIEIPLTTVITSLKTNFYFNYLTPMVMIAALWLGYVGFIKRRTTEFLGGLVWTVGALASSVVLMTHPLALVNVVNNTVTGITQNAVASITSYSPEANMCSTATETDVSGATAQVAGAMGSTANNSASRNSTRAFQCNQWVSFSYTPWVMGQFGMTPDELSASNEENNGFLNRVDSNGGTVAYVENGFVLDTLKDQSGNKIPLKRVTMGKETAPANDQNWALYLLDHKSNWDEAPHDQKVLKTRAQMAVYANQLGASNYNADFHGDNAGNRIAVATTAGLGAAATNLMVLVLVFSLLIMDLVLIILTALSPIFFLLALHPGVGRRIALSWLSTILQLALNRIILSVFLAVMVSLLQVVMVSSMTMGWLVSTIMTIAIAAAGISFQKQIKTIVGRFQFFAPPLDMPDNIAGFSVGQMGKKAAAFTSSSVLGLGTSSGRGAVSGLAAARGTKSVANSVLQDAATTSGAGPAPQQQHRDGGNTTYQSAPDSSFRRGADANVGGATESPNAGAGEAPQASQAPVGASESYENVVSPTSGAGPAPEPAQVAPVVPQTRQQLREEKRDRKGVEKFNTQRIQENLKREGYQSRTVTLGTVIGATARGAITGARTGSTLQGMRASSAYVNQRKQEVLNRNATAVSTVTKNEAQHNREHDRRNAALEREKQQEAHKAERDAQRAARQQKPAVSLPPTREQSTTAPAPQVPASSPTPQVANVNSVPEAPAPAPARRETAPTPAPTLAPKVAAQQSTPAPQVPALAPKAPRTNSTPEAPAPAPKVSKPKVERPAPKLPDLPSRAASRKVSLPPLGNGGGAGQAPVK